MPASRPQWKGYLKLSLVSCPIAIYPAVSAAERISFRQINRNTGNRLRQQLVDAVTGEVVDSSDKGRGDEVGDSSFLPVEDKELEVARQQAQARRPGAATVQPPAPAPISEAPFRKPDRPGGRAATPVPSPAAEPPRLVVENTRTIDIERFVPRGQIDARYIETVMRLPLFRPGLIVPAACAPVIVREKLALPYRSGAEAKAARLAQWCVVS